MFRLWDRPMTHPDWEHLMTSTIMNQTPQVASHDTDRLVELDRRHLIRSLPDASVTERAVITRGEGMYVWDSEGNRLLDTGGGGVWHSPIGHGRADMAQAAAAQIQELEFFTSLQEYTTVPAIELASRLAELSPTGLNRVFFGSGGSEAVETALKAARLYHVRKGQPQRTWLLSRHASYHGTTYGSGTVTGLPPMHMGVGPNLPHVEKLSPPYLYRADQLYGTSDPTDFLIDELHQTIDRIGAENIAAMIGEPVMAGGGVLEPPADYWPRVRQVLRDNGILLIADEVVTAFGRLGSWFASEERDMDPDMITTAKGIAGGYAPLAATLFTDEVADAITNDGGFFHGYTFQGHPLACALGLKTLDILENEGLLDQAPKIASWLTQGLQEARGLPVVGDVRVVGSLAALELVADKNMKIPFDWHAVSAIAAEVRRSHDVIVRPYGYNLVLSPPLIVTEAQVAEAADAVTEVLSRTSADGSVRPR